MPSEFRWPRLVRDECAHFHKTKECLNAEEFNRVFDFRKRLRLDCAPVFFAGGVKKMEYCLLGLNPAFNEENYSKERRVLEEKGCEQTYLNFFDVAIQKGIKSDYYFLFSCFLAGFLEREKPPEDSIQSYQLLSRNIVNLNLIPYHSRGITLPKKLTAPQGKLIAPYLKNLEELIRLYPRKALFLNGARFDSVHKEIGFRRNSTPISVNTKLRVHVGECFWNKNSVWFDKFVSFRVIDKGETRKEFCRNLFDAGSETQVQLGLNSDRGLS